MGTYAAVADLREQGLPDTITDVRATAALEAASRLIDRVTGYYFELRRNQSYTLDGDGTPILELPVACLALSGVKVTDQPVDTALLVNYNRPPDVSDDFWYPRLEWQGGPLRLERAFGPRYRGVWWIGSRNIEVTGDFGFVVDSPTVSGAKVPPPEITRACVMIAQELLRPVLAGDNGASRLDRYLQSEKLGDYSYSFGPGRGTGMLGLMADPDIDAILARYTRSQMSTPGPR